MPFFVAVVGSYHLIRHPPAYSCFGSQNSGAFSFLAEVAPAPSPPCSFRFSSSRVDRSRAPSEPTPRASREYSTWVATTGARPGHDACQVAALAVKSKISKIKWTPEEQVEAFIKEVEGDMAQQFAGLKQEIKVQQ